MMLHGQPSASARANDAAAGVVPLVLVGAGNIGSHLAQHIARLSGVAWVTLIDRDVYEQRNLSSQNITPADVGRAKVAVQARRLRQIAPGLCVATFHDAVENVPLGVFRGAIVLGCLDSRAARRYLAAAAWHAGALAYIDAGVEPTGLLVRIDAYVAGADTPCFECAWSAADYAAQEQHYPCDGDADAAGAAPPTDAPSGLGALAAALQAVECRKLLDGHMDRALVGRQVVLDASWHKHYVTALRRNPACRFDHEVWPIDARSPVRTIDDVLAASGALSDADVSLCVPGQTFVRRLTCTACKRSRDLVYLLGRLRPVTTSCATCGQRMMAAGFDMTDRLRLADLPAAARRAALRSLGLRRGDVVAIRSAQADRYFLVGSRQAVRAE